MKRLPIDLTDTMYMKLKIYAAKRNISMVEIARQSLIDYFEKRGEK